MIKGIKDYLKQWLSLLYFIPSTISVLQTFFHEEIKDTWLSFIDSLTKVQILYTFIIISVFAGINIAIAKNKVLVELKDEIRYLKHNSAKVPTTINNNYYLGDISLMEYVNSNVIIGDRSEIN